MNILVPFGFYGFGNIGDEATLQGFARLLARRNGDGDTQVCVASRNPSHTARVEPSFRYFRPAGIDFRRWVANVRASAHVVAGGTPIMDVLGEWPLCELAPLVKSIDRWNVPLSFVGVGVETLRAEESLRTVADEIVPRVSHWSVRSDRDRQRLTSWGGSPDSITVAADMAWLIPPTTQDFGRTQLRRWGIDGQRPLLGVNLVNENLVMDRRPEMVGALAAALDALVMRLDGRVIFLANEVRPDPTFDTAAAMRVRARMTHRDRTVLIPSEYFSPSEMMSIVSCCSLTMSMRYHFCVFSALQAVPFIAIQRTSKISDLCLDLEWHAGVASPDFDAATLIARGDELINDASVFADRLLRRASVMREYALRNDAALDALWNGTMSRSTDGPS